jgi:exonuclease III
MSDMALNIVTLNVRGISNRSCGKVKCGRLRNNLRTLTPSPSIVMLQEHKIPDSDCTQLGAMGMRKGRGFWNGSIFNVAKNRWKAGTSILISAKISHLFLNSGILVPSRAQWITCSLDNKVVGFLNIYAPNKDSERAAFWNQIATSLPIAESWVVGGDFNMVERNVDRSCNTPKK